MSKYTKSFLIYFYVLIFCTAFNFKVFAQKDTIHPLPLKQDTILRLPKQKLIIAALPVIGSSPTTSFVYGAVGTLSKYLGAPSTTHLSSAAIGFIQSVKRQTFITAKSTIFLKNDSWNLLGDWRYVINTLPNFGLGTGPQSQKLASSTGFNYSDNSWSTPIPGNQQIDFTQIRVHEVLMKKIAATRFFAGLGYRLDIYQNIKDNLLDLDTVPPVITSHYAYSVNYGFNPKNYNLSSISLDFVYDSRDNTSNPYKGRYAYISYRISPEFLGSSKASSNLWLEYRDYFSLSKKIPRHLIGVWVYGHFQTSGEHGYLALPASGLDQYSRSTRPYTQGRFRGQNLVYAETEYRFPIYKFLGGVCFVNATTATNSATNNYLFKYIDPAAGLGLRIMVSKKSRANICIDYAWGKYGAQGLIINIAEVF